MKIGFACDHAAVDLKNTLLEFIPLFLETETPTAALADWNQNVLEQHLREAEAMIAGMQPEQLLEALSQAADYSLTEIEAAWSKTQEAKSWPEQLERAEALIDLILSNSNETGALDPDEYPTDAER